MGHKDYLSGGCDIGWCAALPRKLCYEKLDKKSENDYMIIWLCQKFLIKIWSKRSGPDPLPSPLPPQKKKKKKIGFFVKIHLLENSK